MGLLRFKSPFLEVMTVLPKVSFYLPTFEQLILIRNIIPSIYFDIPEYSHFNGFLKKKTQKQKTKS